MNLKFENIKMTLSMRMFAFFKIPLLWFAQPTIIEFSDKRMIIKIPLTRRTRNHLRVMYFGALSMGAEASIGASALFVVQKKKKRVDIIFKDFHADFLKRAEGDVHFICDEIPEIEKLVDKTIQTKERETQTFKSYAIVPSVSETDKVAEFSVTLSLKYRGK